MAMTAAHASSSLSINRFGLTPVYAPAGEPLVDVVFVHGLNGSPEKTWTSEKSKIFWPEQLLPPFLEEERARILTFGYDADVVAFTDGASRDKIHNHAENLVQALAANRRLHKAMQRPIVFVTHSLGGLVVKRALVHSAGIMGTHTEHLRSISVSTFGILFLGTPHLGSNLAKWGSMLEWICGAVLPSKVIDTEPQLVEALTKNNETLQNIDRQFLQLAGRLHIFFFHEGKKTNLKGTLQFVVDEESAAPNIQDVERSVIQQDHSHMCKFENESAPGFDLVAEAIQRYCGEAPDVIKRDWQSEQTAQALKKQAEAQNLLSGSLKASPQSVQGDAASSNSTTPDASQILQPKISPVPSKRDMKDDATNTDQASTSSKSSEPYFIVPPWLRANTFFVGMEKEYRELDRRLFDRRRRDGTACVLLHGQPGGGKSHLARQYIYKNKSKFSGGIFWIDARLREELFHAFWDIKQKIVARESPDLCAVSPTGSFAPVVKSWFEKREQWLIVFDGLVVDRDEDSAELMDFIPFSKNSSIIYISRQKSLASKERLLRPHPIKVGPLKEDDAKKLLFKVLGKKKPSDAEQKKATELVRKIGGLPLAIDAISHRLADTQEPLTKFKLSFLSDPTLEGTYNQILGDLLDRGHAAAWNLIHILCWFGQNIPVEMIHLGMKTLRAENVDIKSIEEVGQPDLNTTFSILIRNALVERNEPESDKDSISSSRESLAEPIDMLKMHGVVQSFCCDKLNATGRLPRWLGYAVKLFSDAYRQADRRIKQREERGRISDYRYFKVHGQRLWDHTAHYENRLQPLESLRAALHPVMEMINKEISSREPTSSQESLKNGVFQISIFDRTSSSSDSGPSAHGPRTPRPTPPPLENESLFGFPLGKEPTDSPRSLNTPSPGARPKTFGGSPSNHPLEYEDQGYDSDREGPRSHAMRLNISETTVRPHSRSRGNTTESKTGGWQEVPPRRKPQNRRRKRDLGSYRQMTPSQAEVDTKNAYVYQSRREAEPRRRESSPAFRALEKVQKESPSPPPSQNRMVSFQTTWAKVVAGLSRGSSPSNVNQDGSAGMKRARSKGDPKERQSYGQNFSGSPLATEFVPQDQSYGQSSGSGEMQPQSHYSMNSGAQQHGLSDSRSGSYQHENIRPGSSSGLMYEYSEFQPNPNYGPLLIDTNTSVARTPYPDEPTRPYEETPQTAFATVTPRGRGRMPSDAFFYEQTSFPVPTGYTSQPMSRDHSHQSQISTAETEPLHSIPSFSPYVGPTKIPNTTPLRQHTGSHFHPYAGDISPRGRRADGRPMRKSPRTEYAVPHIPSSSISRESSRAYSRDPSQDFNIASSQNVNTTASANMTRGSRDLSAEAYRPVSAPLHVPSSGPGIALTDPFTGADTGVIVGFENSPHLPPSPLSPAYPVPRSTSSAAFASSSLPPPGFTAPGHLQFGAHAPFSLDEARRRTLEAEEKVRLLAMAKKIEEEERARRRASSRGKGRVYPDINLIPTVSDRSALDSMMDPDEESDYAERPPAGSVGLGVKGVPFDR